MIETYHSSSFWLSRNLIQVNEFLVQDEEHVALLRLGHAVNELDSLNGRVAYVELVSFAVLVDLDDVRLKHICFSFESVTSSVKPSNFYLLHISFAIHRFSPSLGSLPSHSTSTAGRAAAPVSSPGFFSFDSFVSIVNAVC